MVEQLGTGVARRSILAPADFKRTKSECEAKRLVPNQVQQYQYKLMI